MNTRKYARTLDEAFPFGPEYGSAITRVYRRRIFADVACATVLGLLLAYGLMAWAMA